MKSSKKLNSDFTELPVCIISYIFSKLGLKDLVKTSTLSKLWRHEFGLRMDLNFDLQNMFDSNKVQQLPKSLPLLQGFQSEFANRLHQFMLHYQGAMIDSIRVNFPLDIIKHSDVIGRLITKGVTKGAKRIELLFSHETNDTDYVMQIVPYKFSFTCLSNTDSLTYLHLQNCHVVAPKDFSGLKNLRTFVLQQVAVEQNMLKGLFSNCKHLVDFTLDDCEFKSDLKIITSTLCHLNIVNSRIEIGRKNIDIIASNLSTMEYSCNSIYRIHRMNIEAHMLSKFSFRGGKIFTPGGFSGFKNVTTIVLEGLRSSIHNMSHLFSECFQLEDVTFQNCTQIMNIISLKLRHLKIIDCGHMDFFLRRINIDALNLSSFEYSGHTMREFSVKAPSLLKVFWNAAKREKNPYPFGPIKRLSHIENLAMIMSTSQIRKLRKALVQFQNLRQLELFIEGAYDPNMDYFWILDIAMASQPLEKLSLTIRNIHMESSHMAGFKRQRREYAGFFHNDLKYVKLRGCVCSINVIELASLLLRNASSLKQITFSSLDKFYLGAGRWTNGSDGCCWFDRKLIHEMLKDEVNEQCQLVIF